MPSSIGTAVSRVDGRAKVTGAARYAAELNVPGLLHAAVVSAHIAKGRILQIDASPALAVPGVLAVLTHENRPPMARSDRAYQDDTAPEGSPFRPLYDDKVRFSSQPVALVVAEEWETARFAAGLVRVSFEKEPDETDWARQRGQAFAVEVPAQPRGKADAALAAAEVRHEADYSIPVEHHNPMELFASTVIWDGDGRLTVYDKTQGVQNVQRYLCGVFGMKADRVRVVAPYVGGAFGSGLRPQHNVTLAVLAALALERSVRLVLTRRQMYALCYRPATVEHLAIGAKADGTLEALTHEALAVTSRHETFHRNDTGWSGVLYRCANASYAHRLVRLDLPTPADMRAPGGATGVYGLECAIDEVAVALGIDPLALRLKCYTERDQNQDLPFSSKRLRECYRAGAEAFGWDGRNPAPRSMRDGSELVGWGMATGIWEAMQEETAARIVLTANGHAEVACATADIGTGTYTIMTQLAADMLGLPLENVTAKLGDSSLPQAPVEGGSWTAASVAGAIGAACNDLLKELVRLGKNVPNSPLKGMNASDVMLADGKIMLRRDNSLFVPVANAMRHAGVDRIAREASAKPKDGGKHAHYTHSAVFAEVKIDEELDVIRVTRAVNAVAAGRILNPKTARSQVLGGVVWGIGMALHEESLLDHAYGRFMNADIAEYHVPVNADVHDVHVILVEEPDAVINPLGIKGVGEIGIVGTAAAIANAVFHATGKRVRDLPIRLDKLRR